MYELCIVVIIYYYTRREFEKSSYRQLKGFSAS
ncbi:MAG: hypothetical protein JW384_01012 [Nitrosomonadaceae bacterium]|nr:hypothetical protein [Nitrosomonadaceae bacterium]